jgi:putative acetyltransferase
MIRKLRTEDIDNAVSIWFEASIKAHNFISEEFWSSQKQNMRELYLPNCESWVYESEGKLIGFVSYYEGSIPAIFVDPDCQSRGVGTQLLNHVKSMYNKLTLTVYVDNESTYRFYQHHGFIDLDKCICEHTGKQQMEMCWENAGS